MNTDIHFSVHCGMTTYAEEYYSDPPLKLFQLKDDGQSLPTMLYNDLSQYVIILVQEWYILDWSDKSELPTSVTPWPVSLIFSIIPYVFIPVFSVCLLPVCLVSSSLPACFSRTPVRSSPCFLVLPVPTYSTCPACRPVPIRLGPG
jgi:hypothetical protein